MTYRLIPIDKGASPVISLHRPVLLIGRHPECDVRIDLPKISRRHCCLALAYDRLVIRDLGSHNGVRLNGQIIDDARLKAGDEVAIGPIIYRVELESPQPPLVSTPARPTAIPQQTDKRSGGASRPTAPLPVSQDSEIDLVPLDDF
jgi:pSer/pThr/pTyr-binding forkhead associated (FHA) protein